MTPEPDPRPLPAHRDEAVPAPGPFLADAGSDADAASELRRYRVVAGGFLALAAGGWAASHAAPLPPEVALPLRAVAEAGLVGGLADWFAVTALFRRPLGLPIPHTALVPRNRDRIADGIAAYIDREFLEPAPLLDQVRGMDLAGRLARLLQEPDNRDRLAAVLVGLLPSFLGEDKDAAIKGALTRALKRGLEDVDLRQSLARLVRAVVESREMEAVIQDMVERLIHLIHSRTPAIQDTISRKSPWWVPGFVDAKLAGGVADGVMAHLYDLRDPNTGPGRDLRRWLSELADGIEQGSPLGERLTGALRRVLEDESFGRIIQNVVATLRGMALEDMADPQGRIRAGADRIVASLAEQMDAPALRAQVNDGLERAFVAAIPRWRRRIQGFVSGTLKAQDVGDFTRRLEARVGKDLQYIRINGTILGAAIGGALYLLNGWLS